MKIAIVGACYFGMSNGILLSQHHEIVTLDIVSEKVAILNRKKFPTIDMKLEDYLQSKLLNLGRLQIKKNPIEVLIK